MLLLDSFEDNDVELRVYNVNGEIKFWVRAGAALLEFDEDRFISLLEILFAFAEEAPEYELTTKDEEE